MRAIDYQIQLQEEMQTKGLNLVCCNNCNTILIHTHKDEEVICPSCFKEQHVNSCQDLYYEGCWSPNEDEQKEIEQEYLYDIFVNGRHLGQSNNYDYIYQRGLGIALYLRLDFENTKSKNIIDKWTNGKSLVIITKQTK